MSALSYYIRFGRWQKAKPSLEEHSEAGRIRVRNKLYVIGGYQTLTRMCNKMQIYDIETDEWTYGPGLPSGFPLSHAGIATDGRYIFVVSGQPGPACEPATDKCWALDLYNMTWESLAPLPGARYAPVLQYVSGNLHLISGAIEDRVTISTDHFVLRVRESSDQSLLDPSFLKTQAWQKGPGIPVGGDHAGSVVLDNMIFVIGGEHGHGAMTFDPAKCCGTYHVHNLLYRFSPIEQKWERLADMPWGSSHIESQILIIDGRIIVLGGTGNRDIFVNRVQEYDPNRNCWRQMDRLPHGRKGGLVWEKRGFIYFNGGQTISGRNPVVAETMVAKVKCGSWLASETSKIFNNVLRGAAAICGLRRVQARCLPLRTL